MHYLKRGIVALSLCGVAGFSAADVIIDGQTIPAEDVKSISVSRADGNVVILTFDGYTVTKNGSNPNPTGSVVIDSFTVTPSSIAAGESVTIAWETSNAESCNASGGYVGWPATNVNNQLPDGSTNLVVNDAGGYTFRLTCEGSQAGDSVQATDGLTVSSEEPIPVNCSTPPLSGSSESWKSFWLVDFPMPVSDNKFMFVPKSGYKALKFETGSIVDDGKFTSIETTQTTGVRLGSVSQCPGDFDVDPECQFVWGIGGGLRWATNGRSGACQLQPNSTYYFNLTYTDGVDPATTTCMASPCVNQLQHTNF